jgi:transglutaminase-like putative cysteine protease
MASESVSMRANSSTSQSDDYYRSVDESRILDFLCIAGWAEQYRRAPQAARDAATTALERWIAAGLPFRVSSGSRAFDPAEVINFAKTLGISGEDDFWEHAYVATARSLIEDLRAGGESSPRRFHVRLERHVNLAHYDVGARVRINLPLPLEGDVYGVTEIQADVLTQDVKATIDPGRIVASLSVPENRIASVAAEIAFLCHGERSERSERRRTTVEIDDTELYLRPSEGLIEITPRVVDLAKKLGINEREPLAAMQRIWDYMFEEMTLGVVHYDALPTENALDAVIESGLFDCRLGAALLVALCRAVRIPARMRSGYALYAIPFYHYWAEFWTEERGWLPFDLICWDLSLRGRDAAWRDVFFGKLDARMPTETLPRTFTGFPSVQFPNAWHVLSRPIDKGAAFGLFSVETEALVYEDRFSFIVNA